VRSIVFLLLSVVGPLTVSFVHADSEGYYYRGPGYFAYQFGMAAPPVAPHRLYVIRLGGREGIAEPIGFDLPQFQVHGLVCSDTVIRLLAYDSVYTVHIDSDRRPVRSDVVRLAPGVTPPEFIGASHNLGILSRPVYTLKVARLSLFKDSNDHEFLLEIKPNRVASEPCATEITSRVVEINVRGDEVRNRVLFRGKGYREFELGCPVYDR
jgi:hypothetical protein